MKLNKKVWLIVVIVIFAVALGVLFSIYTGQARELGQLEKALNATEKRESGLEAQHKTLEGQLTQAESDLKEKQKQFPESVESIEYDDDLFEIADDCNVGLTKLTASKPTNKTVGTVTYSVSSFVVVVKGSIDNILEFIYAIRTGEGFDLPDFPWSAKVTSVKINVSSGTATVNLVIYGYKR